MGRFETSGRRNRRSVYAVEDKARRTRQWAAWETIDVSGNRDKGDGWMREIHTAYRNGWCVVQARTLQTPFGAVEHLVIRTAKMAELGWAEKQRIKAELVGSERVAVEVYPAASATIDAAPIYHLWVLAAGMRLPFGLHASDPGSTGDFSPADFRAGVGLPEVAA